MVSLFDSSILILGGKYAIGVVESTSAVAILQCINNTTIEGRRVRVGYSLFAV